MNPSSTFITPTKQFTTEGCFARVKTPAAEQDVLLAEISTKLRQAKSQKIENPIIVGAIPFNPGQPSALFIPLGWRETSREEVLSAAEKKPVFKDTTPESIKSVPEHDAFVSMVDDAVGEIQQGNLDKVVLSRLLNIEGRVDPDVLLGRLVSKNPQGFSFHLPIQDGSSLVGSSPELLIRKTGEEFNCEPLAGSAPRGATKEQDEKNARDLLNSEKDLKEHMVVVKSVKETLTYTTSTLTVPEVRCVGNPALWHLCTPISGKSSEPALSLACKLHPTPALSGYPHTAARDLLSDLEPFDRKYFGGIAGWSDSEGNGEWFIIIRSSQIWQDYVQLFAGAGIVGDSVAENEWIETATKFKTMLRALGLEKETA